MEPKVRVDPLKRVSLLGLGFCSRRSWASCSSSADAAPRHSEPQPRERARQVRGGAASTSSSAAAKRTRCGLLDDERGKDLDAMFTWWPATWVRIRCSRNSGTVTSWANRPGWRASTTSHSRRAAPPEGGPSLSAHISPRPRTSRTISCRSTSGRVSSSSRCPSLRERSTSSARSRPPTSRGRRRRRGRCRRTSSCVRRRAPSCRTRARTPRGW